MTTPCRIYVAGTWMTLAEVVQHSINAKDGPTTDPKDIPWMLHLSLDLLTLDNGSGAPDPEKLEALDNLLDHINLHVAVAARSTG